MSPVIGSPAFNQLCSWENLLQAWRSAAKGKRGHRSVAAFEYRLADRLLDIQDELFAGAYQPAPYTQFVIHEPKVRVISAAAFRDRIVHHALCNILMPRFEPVFISASYANRTGKGTHAAIDRFQTLARRYPYVLRADIVQYFPSIDHQILLQTLERHIPEPDVMHPVRTIVDSGRGLLDEVYRMQWFAGDDLLSLVRPRGLPIGNLTSQFWANCYLHPFDQFVTRELGCTAYLRYVDDFALFADDKPSLWRWKQAIMDRLQRFRLVIHARSAQVVPVESGIPWLGFVVFPTHRRVKGRKVRHARRHLHERLDAFHRGEISFEALTAIVQGWINHVGHADSWQLRKNILADLAIDPDALRRDRKTTR